MESGFTLRTFQAYPRHLGVEKNNCIALLELTPEGRWRQFSSPGYLIEGQIGLLVEGAQADSGAQPGLRECKRFVYKAKSIPAEGAVWQNYVAFREELSRLLSDQ